MNETNYDGLPKDLGEALKRCDLLAGPEQLELYYQLYDPKTGGFYYSTPARVSQNENGDKRFAFVPF